jgi:biotin carboxylase
VPGQKDRARKAWFWRKAAVDQISDSSSLWSPHWCHVFRMLRALREFSVEGIKTTIPFHIEVFQTPEFIRSMYNTGWVENRMTLGRAA